jgi:hypothetical protein
MPISTPPVAALRLATHKQPPQRDNAMVRAPRRPASALANRFSRPFGQHLRIVAVASEWLRHVTCLHSMLSGCPMNWSSEH